jgi:hypothetical protein
LALKNAPDGRLGKAPFLIVPKSEKRYSPNTHQLLVMAYWRPPPAVQPVRVVEKLPLAKKGGTTMPGRGHTTRRGEREVRVEASEGDTASAVDHDAVPGNTKFTAN